MIILDGRRSAAALHRTVRAAVGALRARRVTPSLHAVLVGNDPASMTYVNAKHKQARALGIDSRVHHLAARTSTAAFARLIRKLNLDRRVDGILVQLPLPKQLDNFHAIQMIDPEKDVDGLHAENLGLLAEGRARYVPCTPRGILHLLDFYRVPLVGRHVVIVGYGTLVGRPLTWLLLRRMATVTVCQHTTRDLAAHTREADVLVSAVGVKHLIRPKHIKRGAVVIDVGIHRTANGLTGDVSPACASRAGAITPVPGGVGPETIAQLMCNTVRAAARRLPKRHASAFARKYLNRL